MQQTIWLFIGSLATLVTIGTILAALVDDALMIVGGGLGFFLWGVWTYGSLNVEQTTRCCVVRWSEPAVTLLGVMLALVPLWFALTGGPELIKKFRNPDTDEV